MLIVDDDRTVRQLMISVVSGDGYRTLEAENGHEAIVLAEANHVDLIVTDLDMPGMTGMQLISTLQVRGLIERWLLVTGSAQALDRHFSTPLLEKPFTFGQFLGKIHALLND
ncbi:MAG TPA: response regulator [Bryobacteraceae bacterium]|nr:response regulator [Bryobacteraceae bacterium]